MNIFRRLDIKRRNAKRRRLREYKSAASQTAEEAAKRPVPRAGKGEAAARRAPRSTTGRG